MNVSMQSVDSISVLWRPRGGQPLTRLFGVDDTGYKVEVAGCGIMEWMCVCVCVKLVNDSVWTGEYIQREWAWISEKDVEGANSSTGMDRLAAPFTEFRIAFCLKIHYHHPKSPPLAPTLIKINPPTPYYIFKMHFNIIHHLDMSRDNPVGIATGYELDSRGSLFGRGKIFFSFPQRLDRLWDPPSLISNNYQGLFRWR
jgi:hypothetical protein